MLPGTLLTCIGTRASICISHHVVQSDHYMCNETISETIHNLRDTSFDSNRQRVEWGISKETFRSHV